MAEYYAGVDIGSTMTKVIILNEDEIHSVVGPTGPEQRHLANKVMEDVLQRAGITIKDLTYIVSTGYGRINVPFSDKQVTEISCHARGIVYLFPQARTIIDIGGQDSKGIIIDKTGRPTDFIMNDKCAAGSGRFLEVIADSLQIDIEQMGEISFKSRHPASISNLCTVWAEQEVVQRLAEGVLLPDLVAGIHESLAKRVVRMVKRLKIEKDVIVTGGVAMNSGVVSALSEQLGLQTAVPSDPLLTGALGAALFGKDVVTRAGKRGDALKRKKRVLGKIEIL